MKNYLPFFALALFFTLPSAANSCSCALQTPAEAFNDAKSVFIGKPLSGSAKRTLREDDGSITRTISGKVSFSVDEDFKGGLGKTSVVRMEDGPDGSCGFSVEVGVTYLVYTYEDKELPGIIYTGMCSRTAPFDDFRVREDIAFLRSLPVKGKGGTIKGQVGLNIGLWSRNGLEGLWKIPVNLKGPSGKVTATYTNDTGQFSVTGLPEGVYSASVEVPPPYYAFTSAQEVFLSDRGTATISLEVRYDNHIIGRITDKDGVSYDHADLRLSATGVSMDGGSTGTDGSFAINGVPPGKYLVFIKLRPDLSEWRTGNYYYPGTYDISKAEKITIGVNETLRDIRFTLPEEIRIRRIEGKVVWPDGSPAADAEVVLSCPAAVIKSLTTLPPPQPIKSDKDGNFSVEAFAGVSYSIIVSAPSRSHDPKSKPFGREIISANIKPVKVEKDISGLRFVLDRNEYVGNCSK